MYFFFNEENEYKTRNFIKWKIIESIFLINIIKTYYVIFRKYKRKIKCIKYISILLKSIFTNILNLFLKKFQYNTIAKDNK